MVFSHDSKFLFWGDISQKDYKIRIWNLGEHRLENQRLEGHEGHTGPVRALAITAADNLLASAAADKTVRLWRIIPSEDGSTPSLEELGPPIVHPAAIFGLSVSHDGKNLAVGSESHTIFLYDLTRQAQVPIGVAWSQWAYGTSLYHDVLAVVGGKQLDGIYAEVIQLWDVSRRHLLMESPLRTYEKYRPTYVAKVQFSADGRTLTLLGDQGVSVIDATSLTETSHPFSLADLGIHGVYRGRGPLEEPELMEPPKFGTIALSSDGRLLARVDSKVRVWDTVTKQLLADIPIEKPSFHATFDSSGKYFATIIDDEIHIWKTDSFGNSLPSKFTIRAGKEVENIAFAPNSKTIAADLGLTLAVWDLEPAEPKLLWQVSEDQEVGDILFSASSARLISLEKTRLRIWETNTGRLVDQLRMPSDKHSNFDQAIYLTDDVLVTINQNGFKHFDLDVKPWSSRACGIVGRQLTQKEWNYFIGETVPFENTCP